MSERASRAVTSYDTVRYPGLPYASTHPDHLATTAMLHGLAAVPPDRCRVLEVACGDGGNLVPMAYALPRSAFLGIDLARDAIEDARALARRAGVANVAFEALDLTRFPADAGAFDYIVAHGVYSWVPADVREALMALIGRHLAPHGVAFVSYNTYPGCHVRRMMWDMLKFHTAELDDPDAKLTEARALVRLVAHGVEAPNEYAQPIVAEARRMENRDSGILFHDDLSPVNDPVYFHEFADHAANHGLQFLAEAAFAWSSYAGLSADARAALATLDPVTRQQYLDFMQCRRFRETLLCRTDIAVERELSPQRLDALAFTAAPAVRAQARSDPAAEPTAADAAGEGDVATALMHEVLAALRSAAPHALPFDALLRHTRARPEAQQLLLGQGAIDLPAVVLASLQAGVIRPHVHVPAVAFPPGEQPRASAVVRAQLAAGDRVTSLWHVPVKVDDELSRRLLPLLDGTRDRRALVAALAGVGSDQPVDEAALDQHLNRLARLGLLAA